MKLKSLMAFGIGMAAGSAAIAVGLRYRRWKRQLVQRLLSTSRLLETRQGTVEYRLEGNGPVVLFLHGSPGGYDQGIPMAQALDLKGFALLSLSRPGYRRTPLSSGETPEAQADLYAAMLDALNISQVTVVAVSGGGPSALQFVRRYPQRCRGLLMQQFAALKPSPLPGITLPTLIVHGTADVEVPFRQAQELAEAVPGAQLVVVGGGGHLSTLGNKKAVIAIKSFLQKLYVRQDVGARGEE